MEDTAIWVFRLWSTGPFSGGTDRAAPGIGGGGIRLPPEAPEDLAVLAALGPVRLWAAEATDLPAAAALAAVAAAVLEVPAAAASAEAAVAALAAAAAAVSAEAAVAASAAVVAAASVAAAAVALAAGADSLQGRSWHKISGSFVKLLRSPRFFPAAVFCRSWSFFIENDNNKGKPKEEMRRNYHLTERAKCRTL